MACTHPCSCCKGACCYDDGGMVCDQATCLDCEVGLGGTWKGPATDCGDYECTEGCCESYDDEDDPGYSSCTRQSLCVPGYNASLCGAPSCDLADPNGDPDKPFCEAGTTLKTQLAFTGTYTSTTGIPALDSAIQGALNDSYAINRDCCNGGSSDSPIPCGTEFVDWTIYSGSPDVIARVRFASQSTKETSIEIQTDQGSPTVYAMLAFNEGARASSYGCSTTYYDCDESASSETPTTSTNVSGGSVSES